MGTQLEHGFLRRYFANFDSIEGWFMKDAALLFVACNQLIAERQMARDVLEIGVHHGLSAILTAALHAPGHRFVAVDLFEELQGMNTSGSGAGSRETFVANMRRFFPDLSFMDVIASSSQTLSSRELGSDFSFCHIDGGHSARETYHDLELCHSLLVPGGLVILDDYFNANWPGVGEGAFKFHLDHPASFAPVAVGYNKVVLQKSPAPFNARSALEVTFPAVPKQTIDFWEIPTHLFTIDLRRVFDLDASTTSQLVPRFSGNAAVHIESPVTRATAHARETLVVPVRLTSQSDDPINWDVGAVGLSHHVLDDADRPVRWDNPRQYFEQPLPPHGSLSTELAVAAPAIPGVYHVEVDIVWEGVTWLSQRGLVPYRFELTVTG